MEDTVEYRVWSTGVEFGTYCNIVNDMVRQCRSVCGSAKGSI